ncbi:MAG: putative ABC transporter permease [Bacilli bacterium]
MKKAVTLPNRERRLNTFSTYMWFFLIFSFIGCIFEMILCFFQRGVIESRSGLIYGLLTPIYGAGAVLLILILRNQKKDIHIFLTAMLFGGIFEWLCSFFQELLFGTISWDYSKYFLNFGGRTSLYHMIGWGILGFILIKYIVPVIDRGIKLIPNKLNKVLTYIITILLLLNILISAGACYRQSERNKGLAPSNGLEIFFDKTYPDSLLNKIYANKKNK